VEGRRRRRATSLQQMLRTRPTLRLQQRRAPRQQNAAGQWGQRARDVARPLGSMPGHEAQTTARREHATRCWQRAWWGMWGCRACGVGEGFCRRSRVQWWGCGKGVWPCVCVCGNSVFMSLSCLKVVPKWPSDMCVLRATAGGGRCVRVQTRSTE